MISLNAEQHATSYSASRDAIWRPPPDQLTVTNLTADYSYATTDATRNVSTGMP